MGLSLSERLSFYYFVEFQEVIVSINPLRKDACRFPLLSYFAIVCCIVPKHGGLGCLGFF